MSQAEFPNSPAAESRPDDSRASADRVAADGTGKPRTNTLGRVLITVYSILALAATLRAAYQIASKFDEAPLAYALSLVSGIVYIVATVALIKRTGAWRRIAWAALSFEFAGVLIVGTLSLVSPELFAHDSVWSRFGSGYIFVPLVLPVLGMVWLHGNRAEPRDQGADASGAGQGRAAA